MPPPPSRISSHPENIFSSQKYFVLPSRFFLVIDQRTVQFACLLLLCYGQKVVTVVSWEADADAVSKHPRSGESALRTLLTQASVSIRFQLF